MKSLRSTSLFALALVLAFAAASGCSHEPTRVQTTTTTVSDRPTTGGQTDSRVTETVQVAPDGTQSIDSTSTTHTTTPPPTTAPPS